MKRKYQLMKKGLKPIILVIAVILCLARVMFQEYFFHKVMNRNKDNSAPKITQNDTKYLKKDGQSVKIDDYTVTLESYYYEKHINKGHCLISLMQEGKKGKDIPCILDQRTRAFYISFGDESKTYYIDFVCEPEPGTGESVSTPVKKMSSSGDKKYIYFDFFVDINGFKDKITIYDDWEEMARVSEGIASFELKDNAEWRNFTDGEDTISICHYGAEINEGEGNINDFEICMKNGKKYSIKQGDMQAIFYEHDRRITQVRFSNAIDIDDIASAKVKWNQFVYIKNQKGTQYNENT